MIADRPLLDALAREIDAALAGLRVRRVHQPDVNTLVLKLHGPGGARRLLACAGPAEARVHLSREERPNPRTPFPFCMLARKHLEGRPFEEARADPALPVIALRFGPRGAAARERAERERVIVSVEWTGHASTVVLLREDDGASRVLGLLRPLPRAQRDLSAGAAYTLPARPGRLDPRTASAEQLAATVARLAHGSPRQGAARVLSRAFEGIGRRTAAEALGRAGLDPDGPPEAIAAAPERCLAALHELLDVPCRPQMVIDSTGAPVEILPRPRPGPGRRIELAPSISEALERLSAVRGRTAVLEARRAEVLRTLRKQQVHRATKLARRREELGEARRGDRQRILADLLLAQENPARRGESSIEVTDLYDPLHPRVSVLLDPALSLSANAARLYQRAQKSARAVRHLSEVITRGEEEIRFLEKSRAQAEEATDIGRLQAIAREVQEALQERRARPELRGDAPSGGPRRFRVEGWEILAGRHSRDNDRIVTEWGRPDDLWFHARGVPGAHVLLRNPERAEPPAAIVETAARIAAHYSPAREEAGVDVIVAALRYVRKRRGLEAGQVEVTQGRTLRVRPGLPGPDPGSAKG